MLGGRLNHLYSLSLQSPFYINIENFITTCCNMKSCPESAVQTTG